MRRPEPWSRRSRSRPATTTRSTERFEPNLEEDFARAAARQVDGYESQSCRRLGIDEGRQGREEAPPRNAGAARVPHPSATPARRSAPWKSRRPRRPRRSRSGSPEPRATSISSRTRRTEVSSAPITGRAVPVTGTGIDRAFSDPAEPRRSVSTRAGPDAPGPAPLELSARPPRARSPSYLVRIANCCDTYLFLPLPFRPCVRRPSLSRRTSAAFSNGARLLASAGRSAQRALREASSFITYVPA